MPSPHTPKAKPQPRMSAKASRSQRRSKLAEIAAYKGTDDSTKRTQQIPSEEETKKAIIYIFEQVAAGRNLQDILGLSSVVLEEIYTMAHGFYSQGKYKESIGLFQFLVSAKPDSYKFNLGLGSCLHQLKLYEEAAFSFYLTLHIEPENPLPAYFIADSFMKADMKEESNEFLSITKDLCGNNPEFNILKERCDMMQQTLSGKSIEDIQKDLRKQEAAKKAPRTSAKSPASAKKTKK